MGQYQCVFLVMLIAFVQTRTTCGHEVNGSLNSTGEKTENGIYLATEEGKAASILGGYFAKPGMLPYTAVVAPQHEDTLTFCTGALLSSRWVITAAHCNKFSVPLFKVFLGDNLNHALDLKPYKGPGIVVITNEIYTPYGYVRGQIDKDIALLHLPVDVPFNDFIQPIYLPKANQGEYFNYKVGIITGWGIDGKDPVPSPFLKYGKTMIIGNQLCRKWWPSITQNEICVYNQGTSEICDGDSGGPLVVYENNQPIIVGVASTIKSHCKNFYPQVYTRITSYLDWIKKTMENVNDRITSVTHISRNPGNFVPVIQH